MGSIFIDFYYCPLCKRQARHYSDSIIAKGSQQSPTVQRRRVFCEYCGFVRVQCKVSNLDWVFGARTKGP